MAGNDRGIRRQVAYTGDGFVAYVGIWKCDIRSGKFGISYNVQVYTYTIGMVAQVRECLKPSFIVLSLTNDLISLSVNVTH